MSLYDFDRAILAEGYDTLCGVDEAGRGPLAGPVYAAAVILPYDAEMEGLNDSKKLSEKKRELLFHQITDQALHWCIASADAAEIDFVNILQASLLAMRRAVEGLGHRPDLLLVDGNTDPKVGITTRTVVKGDAASAAIAAASILAKVARDRHMLELDKQYPQYRFGRHKGYPTKLHYQLLDAHGPSPVHRVSFLHKWREAKL